MHLWVTKCWRVTRFSTVQNANNARGPTCGGRTAWRFQEPWPDIGFKHESKVQQVVYTSKRTSCQFGVGLTLWLRQYIRMCTHCRNLDAPKFDLFLKIGDYWKQIRVNLPELSPASRNGVPSGNAASRLIRSNSEAVQIQVLGEHKCSMNRGMSETSGVS